MIIEKIRDKKERERLLFFRDIFPRDVTNHDPNQYYSSGDDMAFLPMDRVIVIDETVSAPEGQVLPSTALEYFIHNASHRCIMKFCICRESMECKDYPVELGCLFLGDSAAKIHPDIGDQVSESEALEHADKCREAGLIHLIGKDTVDPLWLNVPMEGKLLTVCNCCPCCCLHRVAIHMPGDAGKMVSRIPNIHVAVTDDCTGCGICVSEAVCIFDSIRTEEDRAVIDEENCRACGRCVDICPEKALSLIIEDSRFVEKTIEHYSEIVDYR
jgi:ferredoxin